MEIGIEPATYRLLLERQQLSKITAGGIYLLEEALKQEEAAINIGKIVAMGESAGQYFREKYGAAWDFKVGDMVLYKRHHGLLVKDPLSGKRFILLNDEHVEAKFKEGAVKEGVFINELD